MHCCHDGSALPVSRTPDGVMVFFPVSDMFGPPSRNKQKLKNWFGGSGGPFEIRSEQTPAREKGQRRKNTGASKARAGVKPAHLCFEFRSSIGDRGALKTCNRNGHLNPPAAATSTNNHVHGPEHRPGSGSASRRGKVHASYAVFAREGGGRVRVGITFLQKGRGLLASASLTHGMRSRNNEGIRNDEALGQGRKIRNTRKDRKTAPSIGPLGPLEWIFAGK